MCPRTVYGYITNKNGHPAPGLRVRAFDHDLLSPDDLMGTDMTDGNGYYEIHYESGHWDSAPHAWTIWRPDIYIKVSAPVNGRCDDGTWRPEKNWIALSHSGVKNNHPHRHNLRRDLQLMMYPIDEVYVHTFQRGVDMWSGAVLLLYGECMGCAPNGDKIEWSYWSFGGPPKLVKRCWYRPKPQCTEEDKEKIRDLPSGHPAESTQELASYLIQSEDIDEDAEHVIMNDLKKVIQYVNDGIMDKAIDMMETLKEHIIIESKNNSITKHAEKLLIASANRFINGEKVCCDGSK